MPRDGSMTLADYDAALVSINIACRKCDRRGRYRIATLIERFGGDKKLPDMIAEISGDCPRRQAMNVGIRDLCGAYLVDRPSDQG
jgi:hypothetical protein